MVSTDKQLREMQGRSRRVSRAYRAHRKRCSLDTKMRSMLAPHSSQPQAGGASTVCERSNSKRIGAAEPMVTPE